MDGAAGAALEALLVPLWSEDGLAAPAGIARLCCGDAEADARALASALRVATAARCACVGGPSARLHLLLAHVYTAAGGG